MAESVLVALSGGIDSAMTAKMLLEMNYKVIGVHFHFFDAPSSNVREITDVLGIRLIEYDARALFHKEVIGYFADFYLQGKTPSPCVYCNPNIKWKLLLKLANDENISRIATGHYINIKREKELFRIYKGVDDTKDQSYYLYGLSQEILSRALTPMGQFTKATLKQQLEDTGLSNLIHKKESTGLCFSRGRSCSEILRDYIPGLDKRIGPGVVINRKGEPIGHHEGYVYYTVGQKQGLQLNTNEKLCVTGINPDNNLLKVDTWESLYMNEFSVIDFYFADISELNSYENIQVKVRGFGLNPEGYCRVKIENNYSLKINLDNPVWAPTPGQPAVFYSDDKLLGGGIISSS